ncbi:MAG: hypothetical protein ACN6OP_20780 [Pseudomonadales bacterium]
MSRLALFRCTHGAMLGQMVLIKNDAEAIEASLDRPAVITPTTTRPLSRNFIL